MNMRGRWLWQMVVGIVMALTPLSAGAEEGAGILVVFGGPPSQAENAETLVAKQLRRQSHRVVTSADARLSRGDAAGEGDLAKIRSAARAGNARYVFFGRLETEVGSRSDFDIKQELAVTTVKYRLVDSITGRTLAEDSRQYKETAPTSSEAAHGSIKLMAMDLSRKINRQVAQQETAQPQEKLAALSNTPPPVFPPPAVAPSPPPLQEKSAAPSRKKTASQAAPSAQDAQGPKIIINSPPLNRGFTLAKQAGLTIKGMAVDSQGIQEVKINGNNAALTPEGHFQYETQLMDGPNHFLVMATNREGRSATKEFDINHEQDDQPPEIILLQPDPSRGFAIPDAPSGKPLEIKGMAKDDGGVKYVKVNGEVVALDEEGRFVKRLSRVAENGQVVIEASDFEGNTQQKIFQLTQPPSDMDQRQEAGLTISEIRRRKTALWGLCVGVSDYTSTSANLKYADDDAASLARFLNAAGGKLFSEVHVKTLVNHEVTRDSIIRNITTHLGKASPDDVVFIFLAGHGVKHVQTGSYYFLPSDADSETLLSNGLRMSDFEESVNILGKNVNKIIIVMDTCHSGALQIGMRGAGTGEELSATLQEASGRFILSASKPGEMSLESETFKLSPDDPGHGAFTYALIDGMKGKARYGGESYISLNDLFRYVAKQVPLLTEGRQHPYFRMEGTDLPFVKVD